MSDPVNHPSHYKGAGIEVIDVIEAFGLDRSFCLGNVLKYVLRHAKKGDPVENLRKAAWYLNREIGRLGPAAPVLPALSSFKLVYLGTPYTKYPDGLQGAADEAAAIAAALMSSGVRIYSPIAHCHALAVHGKIDPTDHSIWLPFDEAMMDAAEALVVAKMLTWEASFGIAHEIKHFQEAGKPVLYLDPGTLEVSV